MRGALVFSIALIAVCGCSERPQVAETRKADDHAWSGAATPYDAAGWKAGDQASWDEQMKRRAQGQNEYSRAATAP